MKQFLEPYVKIELKYKQEFAPDYLRNNRSNGTKNIRFVHLILHNGNFIITVELSNLYKYS